MTIRSVAVGLDPAETTEFQNVLDRMQVQVAFCDSAADAKATVLAGGYHLAFVGYEGHGCGLPFAASLRSAGMAVSRLDCIVIADQMCPALGKAASDMGILCVLVRPVRPSALAAAVKMHIERRLAAAPAKAIA